jgi:hypothetical protein
MRENETDFNREQLHPPGQLTVPPRSIRKGRENILRCIANFFREGVQQPVIGFLIKNDLGLFLTGTNTLVEGCATRLQIKGCAWTAEFRL